MQHIYMDGMNRILLFLSNIHDSFLNWVLRESMSAKVITCRMLMLIVK